MIDALWCVLGMVGAILAGREPMFFEMFLGQWVFRNPISLILEILRFPAYLRLFSFALSASRIFSTRSASFIILSFHPRSKAVQARTTRVSRAKEAACCKTAADAASVCGSGSLR